MEQKGGCVEVGEKVRRRLDVVRSFFSLRCGVFPAALEPIAVAVHLDDVHVVGEAVQQGAIWALGAEDLNPFVEGKVGGHQDRATFVELGEYLEEQFRAGAGQWDEAQFVDDQQIETGQLPLADSGGVSHPWPP